VRVLVDTCTFLWYADNNDRLSNRARTCIEDLGNALYLSVASVWEIAVKSGSGRLALPEPVDTFVPTRRALANVLSLPLQEEAAFVAASLPLLHKDPFDRILICQSIIHGLTILSPDPLLAQYGVRMLW
jgi:PIN domain nuclease of toxin-antitoxin system